MVTYKISPTIPIVISFSGGKDSSAMLAYICENLPSNPKYVVWADTGWEHAGLEEWNKLRCKAWGLELIVVKPLRNFFDYARSRKCFASPSCRECTSHLKTHPIDKWIRNNLTGDILNAIGIRAEESKMRAMKNPYVLDSGLSKNGRRVWDWLPIFDWSEKEVRAYLAGLGIPLHPVYDYLPRLSCQICIFHKKHNLWAVKENNPGAIERVAEVEEEIEFTFFPGGDIISLSRDNNYSLF
jgi:3'-phosphoadenosine 5'-phosphosulfate sulfotransferase (PAPS reductase)/FAD synthetase